MLNLPFPALISDNVSCLREVVAAAEAGGVQHHVGGREPLVGYWLITKIERHWVVGCEQLLSKQHSSNQVMYNYFCQPYFLSRWVLLVSKKQSDQYEKKAYLTNSTESILSELVICGGVLLPQYLPINPPKYDLPLVSNIDLLEIDLPHTSVLL